MTTLTFDTPTTRRRDPQPIPVDLCGEQFTVHRPKDTVLYFAGGISADTASDSDRAMGMLQFLDGTLDPEQRHRFFERCRDRDDPVDMDVTLRLVTGLLQQWTDWPADGDPDPVVIEPADESTPRAEPVTIDHPSFDLEFQAHQPKDIILVFTTAALAATAGIGQQAWAMGMFLDACLDPADSVIVSHRMRDANDDLDLEHVSEIVQRLLGHWNPEPANRQQRRAAAKTNSRSGTNKTSGTGAKSTNGRSASKTAASRKRA